MKAKVKIHPHQDYDKSYTVSINDDLSMEIDYDDVDHQTVDAMVKTLVSVIENNWDDKLYKENLKAEKLKQYNSDKWLREEYPTFEDFYKEF